MRGRDQWNIAVDAILSWCSVDVAIANFNVRLGSVEVNRKFYRVSLTLSWAAKLR